METAPALLLSLVDNSVLLLVLLPLVGAGLVRLLAATGVETVFFTAVANVWLSAGLATAMLFHFDASSRDEPYCQPQIISSLRWLARIDVRFEEREVAAPVPGRGPVGEPPEFATSNVSTTRRVPMISHSGPDVRFVTGVNSLSLWFVALIVAVTLAAVRNVPLQTPRLASRMSLLLVTESTLIGSFVAQDVLLLSFFWLASALCLFLLIGAAGHPERRAAARRFLAQQLVAGLFLTAATAGLAASAWWMQVTPNADTPPLSFSLNRISAAIPALMDSSEASHEFWQSASPWLFVLLISAAALRTGLIPFHSVWYCVGATAERSTLALVVTGCVTSGFYLVARLIIPTFPILCGEIGSRMFLWGVVGAGFVAISAFSAATSKRNEFRASRSEAVWRRVSMSAIVVAASVGIGGLFLTTPVEDSSVLSLQTEPTALRGALLLISGVAGAVALGLFLFPARLSVAPVKIRRPPELLKWTAESLSTSRWLVLSGFSALPLSGAFWGLLLLLLSISQRDPFGATLLAGVVACLAAAASETLRRADSPELPTEQAVELPSLAALIPLLVMLGLMAFRPDLVASVRYTGKAPLQSAVLLDPK